MKKVMNGHKKSLNKHPVTKWSSQESNTTIAESLVAQYGIQIVGILGCSKLILKKNSLDVIQTSQ